MRNLIESQLVEKGIELPPAPQPLGSYVPARISGNFLYLAGQGPSAPGGGWQTGRVGIDVSIEEAHGHARTCGLRLLSAAKAALGSLDRVSGVIKVLGFVNAGPEFRDHPAVINGCSDLFIEVFGEKGRHARSAVGCVSLPANITVEVEAIFEIEPE